VAQVRSGLLAVRMKEGEVAVTCPSCSLYTEIYPANYKYGSCMLYIPPARVLNHRVVCHDHI